MPAVIVTAAPLATSMYSEACTFLVQAAGYACDHVLQNEEVEKRDSLVLVDMRFHVFDALCKRFEDAAQRQ